MHTYARIHIRAFMCTLTDKCKFTNACAVTATDTAISKLLNTASYQGRGEARTHGNIQSGMEANRR